MASLKVASSTEITIDKNVPRPEASRGKGPASKYPFLRMEVGDSFLFPSTIQHPSSYIRAYQQRHKLTQKFSVRKTPEGVRCWRIA